MQSGWQVSSMMRTTEIPVTGKHRGQVNLEFLGAAFIYIAALGALILSGQNALPDFTGDTKTASLNLEARQLSTTLLTTPGRQDFNGGANWQKNNTTVSHATSLGLASGFKQVEREKLMRLRTANPRDSGFNYFNYSQFKQVNNADNQYRFNFTWMPVIETPESFTRGNGDSLSPTINEPDTGYYRSAGNDIHYGSESLNGTTYHFLVTSHNGVYNTTYVSESWDFQGRTPLGEEDSFTKAGDRFTVERFQNRAEEPGALLVLSQNMKQFGASIDSNTKVISLYRYAVLEGEPLRVKVLAW